MFYNKYYFHNWFWCKLYTCFKKLGLILVQLTTPVMSYKCQDELYGLKIYVLERILSNIIIC